MRSVLSIDVANGKSEVLLITEYGEVLIEPYEVKHCLSEFHVIILQVFLFSLSRLGIFINSAKFLHSSIVNQRFKYSPGISPQKVLRCR